MTPESSGLIFGRYLPFRGDLEWAKAARHTLFPLLRVAPRRNPSA